MLSLNSGVNIVVQTMISASISMICQRLTPLDSHGHDLMPEDCTTLVSCAHFVADIYASRLHHSPHKSFLCLN